MIKKRGQFTGPICIFKKNQIKLVDFNGQFFQYKYRKMQYRHLEITDRSTKKSI